MTNTLFQINPTSLIPTSYQNWHAERFWDQPNQPERTHSAKSGELSSCRIANAPTANQYAERRRRASTKTLATFESTIDHRGKELEKESFLEHFCNKKHQLSARI